ncbi:hypothetical protein EDC96DRAFT_541116 [Choanephora cucurbitarum]|nr:hypothetical protein EDC96DRAFT_541116 [Choanephora cucurbitarum]
MYQLTTTTIDDRSSISLDSLVHSQSMIQFYHYDSFGMDIKRIPLLPYALFFSSSLYKKDRNTNDDDKNKRNVEDECESEETDSESENDEVAVSQSQIESQSKCLVRLQEAVKRPALLIRQKTDSAFHYFAITNKTLIATIL